MCRQVESYVQGKLLMLQAFPEFRGLGPDVGIVPVAFNNHAVANEDKMRGEVVFSVSYELELPNKGMIKDDKDIHDDGGKEGQNSITSLDALAQTAGKLRGFITRIIELFDTAMVRCPGGGWVRNQRILYSMGFVCRATGANKKSARDKTSCTTARVQDEAEPLPSASKKQYHRGDAVPDSQICPCLSKVHVSIHPTTPGELSAGVAKFTICLLHTHPTSIIGTGCFRFIRHQTFAIRILRRCWDMGMSPKQASCSLDQELWRLACDMFSPSADNVVNGHKALCNNRNYRLPMTTVASMYANWKKVTVAGDDISHLGVYVQAIASTSAWFEEELRLLNVRAAPSVGMLPRDIVLETEYDDAFAPTQHLPPDPFAPAAVAAAPAPRTAERVEGFQEAKISPGSAPFGFRGASVTEGRWVVMLVPPLAARFTVEAPQSREIVFCDASPSLATMSVHVLSLYTSVCGAAAPLAFFILTAMDEELITRGFREYRQFLLELARRPPVGNPALSRRDTDTWSTGPAFFMSDAEQAIRNAWHSVFPASKQLYCHWHMLRASWENLCKYTRDHATMIAVYDKFREMVYSAEQTTFQDARLGFELACRQRNITEFMDYTQKVWLKDDHTIQQWALFARVRHAEWRGHNTNNVCESQFAIMKDFVVGRTRASSYPRLVDRICRSLMDWYATTLFNRIFDDKLARSSHYLLSTRSTGRKTKIHLSLPLPGAEQINRRNVTLIVDNFYSVPSNSDPAAAAHVVDLSAGLCTCVNGLSGRICTHQVLAWQKAMASPNGDNRPNPFIFPKWSPEDKALFHYVATGYVTTDMAHLEQIPDLCLRRGAAQPGDSDDGKGDSDDSGDDDNEGDDDDDDSGGKQSKHRNSVVIVAPGEEEDQSPIEEVQGLTQANDDSDDAVIMIPAVDDDEQSEVDGADASQPDNFDAVAADALSEVPHGAIDAKIAADMRKLQERDNEALRRAIATGDTALKFELRRALSVLLKASEPTDRRAKFDPSVSTAYYSKLYHGMTVDPSRAGRRIGMTSERVGVPEPAKGRGHMSTGYAIGTNRGRKRNNEQARNTPKGMSAQAQIDRELAKRSKSNT